ncbi:PAS domain-containing protein [Falsiroseomonas sp. E2-1-a20]|uniref:PAS domain-containing protein n=1 Tax=Falsiroseomonas sp. E2-1-a20 TaxID=3239300 RepID=UPI003F40CED4
MQPDFAAPDLLHHLEASQDAERDALPFGVIGMALDGTVRQYNTAEATLSGLTPARVIGRHFFTSVAPCTNNALVARRFEAEAPLDDIIDYVFTLRMAPTPVQLRLLKHPTAQRMYLLVQRRPAHAG